MWRAVGRGVKAVAGHRIPQNAMSQEWSGRGSNPPCEGKSSVSPTHHATDLSFDSFSHNQDRRTRRVPLTLRTSGLILRRFVSAETLLMNRGKA